MALGEASEATAPVDDGRDDPSAAPAPAEGTEPGDAAPPADPLETPEIETWLKSVKAVLLASGFKRDAKQLRKPGQAWGVIRQEPNHMQLHVRAFDDGRLESELELSNKYVQHLWSHRRNAATEVKSILARHGFPTERVSETFVPVTGSKEGKEMPETRTRNSHVALAIAVGIGILAGRQYVKRVILKRAGGRSKGLRKLVTRR